MGARGQTTFSQGLCSWGTSYPQGLSLPPTCPQTWLGLQAQDPQGMQRCLGKWQLLPYRC